jgi:uncharacterized membrane protein (GlpM family)
MNFTLVAIWNQFYTFALVFPRYRLIFAINSMDKIFLIRILLSFFIAGGWITFSTLFAERSGSRLGGLIANLPSNILVSLIFITLVNDIHYLKNVVPGIPIGLSIDIVFLVAFILCLKHNLTLAVIVSISIWFGLAFILQKTDWVNLYVNISVFIIITALALLVIEKKVLTMNRMAKRKVSLNQVLFRIMFGGSFVASIVALSKFINPYFTGIFSTFPAMLLSTLIILTVNQGRAFARATGKTLILSLPNIIVYALGVSFTYPRFGILIGTFLSYLLSVLWVIIVGPIAKRMR